MTLEGQFSTEGVLQSNYRDREKCCMQLCIVNETIENGQKL